MRQACVNVCTHTCLFGPANVRESRDVLWRALTLPSLWNVTPHAVTLFSCSDCSISRRRLSIKQNRLMLELTRLPQPQAGNVSLMDALTLIVPVVQYHQRKSTPVQTRLLFLLLQHLQKL